MSHKSHYLDHWCHCKNNEHKQNSFLFLRIPFRCFIFLPSTIYSFKKENQEDSWCAWGSVNVWCVFPYTVSSVRSAGAAAWNNELCCASAESQSWELRERSTVKWIHCFCLWPVDTNGCKQPPVTMTQGCQMSSSVSVVTECPKYTDMHAGTPPHTHTHARINKWKFKSQ